MLIFKKTLHKYKHFQKGLSFVVHGYCTRETYHKVKKCSITKSTFRKFIAL